MNKTTMFSASAALCAAMLLPAAADGTPPPASPPSPPASGAVAPGLVDAAIERGVAFLKTQQALDGSFSDSHMPALTALPLWAFVRSGAGDSPAATNAANFVLGTQREDGGFYVPRPGRGGSGLGNYNTGVCMSALHESGLAPASAILKARDYVAGSQLTGDDTLSGGFGYDRAMRRRYADLNNTVYAMDAMRRTQSAEEFRPAGEKRADLDWSRALAYVSSLQSREGSAAGGFAYNDRTPQGGTSTNAASGKVTLRAYGSMTYAGVLAMVHCELPKSDPRVKSAFEYCAAHWSLEENPGMGRQGLFFYYDILSRALAAAGTPLTAADGGTVDWRGQLAAKLVALQKADGSWCNDNNRFWENDPVLCTSYALLALSLCKPGATP